MGFTASSSRGAAAAWRVDMELSSRPPAPQDLEGFEDPQSALRTVQLQDRQQGGLFGSGGPGSTKIGLAAPGAPPYLNEPRRRRRWKPAGPYRPFRSNRRSATSSPRPRRAIDAAIQQLDKVRADEIALSARRWSASTRRRPVPRRSLAGAGRGRLGDALRRARRHGGLTSSQAASLEATLARLEAAMGSVLFQISSMNPKLDRLPSLMRDRRGDRRRPAQARGPQDQESLIGRRVTSRRNVSPRSSKFRNTP